MRRAQRQRRRIHMYVNRQGRVDRVAAGGGQQTPLQQRIRRQHKIQHAAAGGDIARLPLVADHRNAVSAPDLLQRHRFGLVAGDGAVGVRQRTGDILRRQAGRLQRAVDGLRNGAEIGGKGAAAAAAALAAHRTVDGDRRGDAAPSASSTLLS